jgi:hypothetical protein
VYRYNVLMDVYDQKQRKKRNDLANAHDAKFAVGANETEVQPSRHACLVELNESHDNTNLHRTDAVDLPVPRFVFVYFGDCVSSVYD